MGSHQRESVSALCRKSLLWTVLILWLSTLVNGTWKTGLYKTYSVGTQLSRDQTAATHSSVYQKRWGKYAQLSYCTQNTYIKFCFLCSCHCMPPRMYSHLHPSTALLSSWQLVSLFLCWQAACFYSAESHPHSCPSSHTSAAPVACYMLSIHAAPLASHTKPALFSIPRVKI